MTPTWRSSILAVCAAIATAACKDKTTEPPRPPSVASITLAGPTTVEVGRSVSLSATVKDASGNALSGRTVTWSSSDPSVASVDGAGTVQGLRRGDVTIGASSEGRSGTHAMAITTSVATIELSPPPASLSVGDTVQLTATLKDASGATLSGYSVSWSSSDPGRARVLNDGRIIGESSGEATITATAEGKSARVSTTVVFQWFAVDIGYDHTCARGSGGRLFCWGGNAEGQVGDGSKTERESPVAISADRAWSSVSAGALQSCGVSNGTGYCWGKNARGQLGDGSTISRQSPAPLAGSMPALTQITSGAEHGCALASTGAAYCWGRNDPGSLGDGTQFDRYAPTPVLGGLTFTRLIAGGYHSCGLTADGTAYCWGSNTQGAVGCGYTDADCGNEPFYRLNPKAPQPVRGDLKFRMLAAGNAHTCGITTDDLLYCWGRNGEGELGVATSETCTPGSGPTSCSRVPLLVSAATHYSNVVAGFQYTCALTTSGEAWCWGDNDSGQLGDGTSTRRSQ